MEILISALALILLLAVGFTIIKSSFGFAPWVPTYGRDLGRIFSLAGDGQGRIFLDLGCGNGRLVVEAAQRGFESHGVELSWPMYAVCRIRQSLKPQLRTRYYFADLFKYDVSNADVIYLFGLSRSLSATLATKLKSQAKPGARIISYCFPIQSLTPALTDRPTSADLPIYIYNL